jgi:hypothetical protein
VQRIVLVPTGAAAAAIPVPRRGLVLVVADPAAESWAASTGLPTEPLPALPVRDLENLVRARAVGDRWRDVVVVADAVTVSALTSALCDLPGSSALAAADDIVVVGLPRGARPVRPLDVVVGAGLLSLSTLVLIGRVYPLVLPAVVAGGGLLLLPWSGSRHLGRTLLAVAGIAAVVVLAVVAGSTRFPVE